jgi:hypothetical protein
MKPKLFFPTCEQLGYNLWSCAYRLKYYINVNSSNAIGLEI